SPTNPGRVTTSRSPRSMRTPHPPAPPPPGAMWAVDRMASSVRAASILPAGESSAGAPGDPASHHPSPPIADAASTAAAAYHRRRPRAAAGGVPFLWGSVTVLLPKFDLVRARPRPGLAGYGGLQPPGGT